MNHKYSEELDYASDIIKSAAHLYIERREATAKLYNKVYEENS